MKSRARLMPANRERPPVSEVGDPVYTVSGVARALGVGIETVRAWDARGVMPFTPRRAQYPGMVEPVRVFSEQDLEQLRVWHVTVWEPTRGYGGSGRHLKRPDRATQ